MEQSTIEAQYKEAVVIGNGPSGIVLSYLMAGHWPYYDPVKGAESLLAEDHPNEFLHNRLMSNVDKSLIEQDLIFLSQGLEGRSNNPVALLFDNLNHPDADLGLELPSLLQWQYHPEKALDHVVLGRGPPGGAWQQMDGSVLTISLGCWMELPTVNFRQWERQRAKRQHSNENRAAVASVASYYSDYVKQQNLNSYFSNYSCVTSIKPLKEDILESLTAPLTENMIINNTQQQRKLVLELTPAPHCGLTKRMKQRLRSTGSLQSFHRKRRSDFRLSSSSENSESENDSSAELSRTPTSEKSSPIFTLPLVRPRRHYQRQSSITAEHFPVTDPWDDIVMLGAPQDSDLLEWCWRQKYCQAYEESEIPKTIQEQTVDSSTTNDTVSTLWEVRGYTSVFTTDGHYSGRKEFCYVTPNVVLATGNSDLPLKLNVPGGNQPFVLHSLKYLEKLISTGTLSPESDPVLIVGAGLSAADAIIAARFHNIPVIHVFRRKVDDPSLIFNQLPQNMYPEYHKVHQMMKDTDKGYEGYHPKAQHVIIEIRPDQKVKIVGPFCCGLVKVSYVLVCIGSKPDLTFLPEKGSKMGVYPGTPIHWRYNPIDINVFTHQCVRVPGIHAMGPLIGENFVRFLQGGALAITSHLHQNRKNFGPITIEAKMAYS